MTVINLIMAMIVIIIQAGDALIPATDFFGCMLYNVTDNVDVQLLPIDSIN